jgi:hypothetical protein
MSGLRPARSRRSGARWLRVASGGLLAACTLALATASGIAPFSAARPGAALPDGWQDYAFGKGRRATRFTLVEDDGKVVLKAQADASAGALIHPMNADPHRTPWLAWRWKVTSLVARADMLTKAGDDFPARVYVLFDYDVSRLPLLDRARIAAARLIYGAQVPAAALCYVWDNRHAPGFTAWNPYTSRVRMIVTESGELRVGHWVVESRDVAQDFRDAFGEEAPAISAVVAAADTDNTGESTASYFGDFQLGTTRAEAEQRAMHPPAAVQTHSP